MEKLPLILALTASLLACGEQTTRHPLPIGRPWIPSPSDAGEPLELDAGALDSGMGGPDAASSRAEAGTGPRRGFSIRFDYRFDTAGFFADPERRQTLEAAARDWSAVITNDFPTVPAGTVVMARDPVGLNSPATPIAIEDDIDDLVVFVGAAADLSAALATATLDLGLDGIVDGQQFINLSDRRRSTPFQPWAASISFDSTAAFHFDPEPELDRPVPAALHDFYSVALHELGHVLGFGRSLPFQALVSGGTFTGPAATALNGGPLPLAPDLGHVPVRFLFEGQRVLMDAGDPPGTRQRPTALDRAVLEDLGYRF